MVPLHGFEPRTYCLQDSCASRCATGASKTEHCPKLLATCCFPAVNQVQPRHLGGGQFTLLTWVETIKIFTQQEFLLLENIDYICYILQQKK